MRQVVNQSRAVVLGHWTIGPVVLASSFDDDLKLEELERGSVADAGQQVARGVFKLVRNALAALDPPPDEPRQGSFSPAPRRRQVFLVGVGEVDLKPLIALGNQAKLLGVVAKLQRFTSPVQFRGNSPGELAAAAWDRNSDPETPM